MKVLHGNVVQLRKKYKDMPEHAICAIGAAQELAGKGGEAKSLHAAETVPKNWIAEALDWGYKTND